MKPIIEVSNLVKRYSKSAKPAVDGFSLALNSGEVFGFVGPNGAGKTTTIKMLLNLVVPDSGGGKILGYDIVRESLRIREQLSYMDGDCHLYNNMKGSFFLDYIQNFFRCGNQQRLNELQERFQVPFDRKIKTYSAGQKQQLALIAALAHDSKLLILDEPTKGLDPSKKKLFLEVISDRAKEGTAVLISSHVLSEIESICGRISFIKDGRLLADEDIETAQHRLENKIFVTFEKPVIEEELKMPQVEKIEHVKDGAILTVKDDHLLVIRQLSYLPLKSLRFRQASLDDLYEKLYLQDEETEKTI
jgi:ABC-2 type transport system ATP-binding protein